MRSRLATVLIALNLLSPNLYAEEAVTPIRTSLAKVKFDFTRSIVLATVPPLQRTSAQRRHHDGAIVAGLATLGLFAGMFIASKVALPCHCEDPESVVARGGLVGGVAGAVAGIVITSR